MNITVYLDTNCGNKEEYEKAPEVRQFKDFHTK